MEGPPSKPKKQAARRTTTSPRPRRTAKKNAPSSAPEVVPSAPEPIPAQDPPQAVSKPPVHPLTRFVAAAALLLFIGSQIVSQLQVQTSLGWQVRLSATQASALESEIARLKKIEAEDQRLETQAESVSSHYEALLKDLLVLAETDPEAQAIVIKFQIQSPL